MMRLLGIFNNFGLEQGVLNAHSCVGGLFSFLKYGINWVTSFFQTKNKKIKLVTIILGLQWHN